MPIFEEKLICPLSVRFTQQHIRPVFQDGHEIEATVQAIKTKPGVGPYDVILEAPFPVIEIMRWHQKDGSKSEPDASHWFTVDNRRLYCMQRVAASLWPRRAAIQVETFYAAPDGALRKSDSTTVGRSVAIGHSLKALVGEWDWRASVQENTDVSVQDARPAQQLVLDDDQKTHVSDLLDAPAPPSMLALFMQNGLSSADQSSPHKFNDAASEGSTRSASTASRGNPESKDSDKSLSFHFVGKWEDAAGDIYQVKAITDDSWSCARSNSSKNSKKVTLWYDEVSDCVCWGSSWSHYMDASDFRKNPGRISWFGGSDISKRKPRFTWCKITQAQKTASVHGGAEAPKHSKESHGKHNIDTSSSSKRQQTQSGRTCRREGATVSKAQ